MKTRTYALKEAERIVPLLRSIGKEIETRRRAAEEIQKHLASLTARLREGERGGSRELPSLEAQ